MILKLSKSSWPAVSKILTAPEMTTGLYGFLVVFGGFLVVFGGFLVVFGGFWDHILNENPWKFCFNFNLMFVHFSWLEGFIIVFNGKNIQFILTWQPLIYKNPVTTTKSRRKIFWMVHKKILKPSLCLSVRFFPWKS